MICQEQDGFEEKEEKGEVGDHPDKVKNKDKSKKKMNNDGSRRNSRDLRFNEDD